MAFHHRYRFGMPAVVDMPGSAVMITARQVAAAQPATHAVSKARHLAVLQAVGRACELSGILHAAEPNAILEDPNGTGMKVELDLLMQDSAGWLIGIDAVVGARGKGAGRAHHVREKMHGGGTVAARVVAQVAVAIANYTWCREHHRFRCSPPTPLVPFGAGIATQWAAELGSWQQTSKPNSWRTSTNSRQCPPPPAMQQWHRQNQCTYKLPGTG